MNILLIIRNFLIYLYVYFNKLNFYTSKSQDEYVQNTGRVSTKIALALLLGSLVSLTFYSGFSKIDQVIAIAVPNFEKYQSLVQDHPSLVCPCSKLDVPYSSFIKLELNYHQVCRSDLVGKIWLTFINYNNDGGSKASGDWLDTSPAQFNLIATLCDLAVQTMQDALSVFYESRLIVSQIAIESAFQSQAQVLTSEFLAATQNAFGRSIDLQEVIIKGNVLVSGLGTNQYSVAKYDGNWYQIPVYFYPVSFTDGNNIWHTCSSVITGTRITSVMDKNNVKHSIPGWRYGCYIDAALFASTFECYYNITCFSLLRAAYGIPLNIQMLDPNEDSRFATNTPIGTIVRQLFLEKSMPSFNFSGYYASCSPPACSYTISERRSFVTIVTTLFGLLGGLTKAIDLFVPRIVSFGRTTGRQMFHRAHEKWKQRTTSVVMHTDHH